MSDPKSSISSAGQLEAAIELVASVLGPDPDGRNNKAAQFRRQLPPEPSGDAKRTKCWRRARPPRAPNASTRQERHDPGEVICRWLAPTSGAISRAGAGRRRPASEGFVGSGTDCTHARCRPPLLKPLIAGITGFSRPTAVLHVAQIGARNLSFSGDNNRGCTGLLIRTRRFPASAHTPPLRPALRPWQAGARASPHRERFRVP
jgi:hypothetical protein